MEVFEAIYTRRSIRRYSDKTVENTLVDKIISAAMYAPSAVNKQPWHFIVFEEEPLKRAVMTFHQSASMLATASKCILVCYDEKLQHDEGYGVIDSSAATQNMLLSAHALGLGACWIGICPRQNRMEGMRTLFNLPQNIVPFSLVSLGYPAETKPAPDRISKERIHHGKW
jgi:nitroreductase